VAEAVEEEIPLNPLLRTLEMMEDQEEVVVLLDLDLLDQVVLEILPLQLLLKEMMEEQVFVQQILLITEEPVAEHRVLVQPEQFPQEVGLVAPVQLFRVQLTLAVVEVVHFLVVLNLQELVVLVVAVLVVKVQEEQLEQLILVVAVEVLEEVLVLLTMMGVQVDQES